MSSSSFAVLFAQVTNAATDAAAAQTRPRTPPPSAALVDESFLSLS